MSVTVKLRLRAMSDWYNEEDEKLPQGEQPDVKLINLNMIKEQLKKMKRKEKGTAARKATSPSKENQKLPHDFNGKQKDWLSFCRAFMAYLGSTTNQNGVPMTYIIRTSADDTGGFNFNNDGDGEVAEIIRDAPLRGSIFNSDNYRVYQLLSGFLLKGTGFVHIEDFKGDGRAAWHSLLAFYQGPDAKSAILAAADEITQNLKYSGEKRNLKFEDYTSKFIQAYQQKKIFGEEVSGEKQVRDFVGGILHDRMSSLAATALGNKDYKYNLQKAAAYIADVARVQGILINKQDDNRKISSTSSWNSGGRGGRGHRHGRGRGRGGRGGRLGRWR
ncbi:MAG: hypothetical protein ACREOZ_01720, partial [Gloeomargaritales cyanobacterium]